MGIYGNSSNLLPSVERKAPHTSEVTQLFFYVQTNSEYLSTNHLCITRQVRNFKKNVLCQFHSESWPFAMAPEYFSKFYSQQVQDFPKMVKRSFNFGNSFSLISTSFLWKHVSVMKNSVNSEVSKDSPSSTGRSYLIIYKLT